MVQKDEENIFENVWWTHKELSLEVAAATSSLTTLATESVISSTLENIKISTREFLKTNIDYINNNDNNFILDNTKLELWHNELISNRDKLFHALIAAHQQQEKENEEITDNNNNNNNNKEHLWTAHQMMLNTIISEWDLKSESHNNNNNNNNNNSSLSSLLDHFLNSIAFTFAFKWDKEGETTMINVICSFVVDILGMTPIEQEELLPQLTQNTWDFFLQKLQELEKEVIQFCTQKEEMNEENIIQNKKEKVYTLLMQIISLLKMLALPSNALDTTTTSNNINNNKTNKSGYITLATSIKAKIVVQSLGKWLPLFGEFLYSMAPSSKEENNNNNNNNNKENDGDSIKIIITTTEALEWIKQLQQEVERIFLLLAELAETSPWIIILADITARTFQIKQKEQQQQQQQQQKIISNKKETQDNDDNDNDENNNKESKLHEALKLFLIWFSKTGVDGTQRTLAEACSTKMSHVLSCALDKTGCPPSNLSISVLRILLVQRPISTLRSFLNFLSPTNSIGNSCDYEAAITDKGKSSEARGNAFREELMEGNSVALIFFPKYFAVFTMVEQVLVSLCNHLALNETDNNNKNIEIIVERFFAAALDESFAGLYDGSTGLSEWLMFLAFICSETPLFESHALYHVRNAAKRFFSPGPQMLKYLHYHIIQKEKYGLIAFFLPPLRAIGIDYSTSINNECVSCALKYPLSAEVAYFKELPRGYYTRHPQRLAINAKNDALYFFHHLLMPTIFKKTNTTSTGNSAHNEEKKIESSLLTRRLFINIIARIGVLVAARLRGEGDRNSLLKNSLIKDTSTMDAMTAVFLGILRLCSTVTYWDAGPRHELQRDIVQQLCELSGKTNFIIKRITTTTTTEEEEKENSQRGGLVSNNEGEKKVVHNNNNNNNNNNNKMFPLPMTFLLRGGCTLDTIDTKYEETTNTTTVNELPQAWKNWFCTMEFEDIDERAKSHAMALLRDCNRNYMNCIQVQTLLARRKTLEEHTKKEKESGVQARALIAMETAIQEDIKFLREKFQKNKDSIQTPQGQEKQQEKIIKPLSRIEVKSYIELIFTLFLQRARMSVVDGLAAGIALKKWLITVAGQFEPLVLLDLIRRLALNANTKLTHSTKYECASLSAFLGIIADDIAIPYKQFFFSPRPGIPKQHEQGIISNEIKEENNINNEWIRRALPILEKHAVELLQLLIADTTRAVTNFLKENTSLGDWKAYLLSFHLRHIMGLVRRHEISFRVALEDRRKKLFGSNNNNSNSGVITSSVTIINTGEATHPVQMLSKLEFPLLPNMLGPAADINHLYSGSTNSLMPPPSNSRASTSILATPTPLTRRSSVGIEGNNNNNNNNNASGGRRGWNTLVETHGRRRRRSHDDSYTYRHNRRK